MSYPQTDIFILLFSIGHPNSFKAVEERWLPELQHHCPETPVLLIGACSDLRSSETVAARLKANKAAVITRRQGEALAKKLNCISYLEISSLQFKNIESLGKHFLRAYAFAKDPASLSEPKDADEAHARIKSAISSRNVYDKLDDYSKMYCTANPTNVEGLMNRALILKRLGKNDDSRQTYLDAIGLIKEKVDLFKAYKKLVKVCTDAKEKESYLRKAIEIHESRVKIEADIAAKEVAERKYDFAANRLQKIAYEEDLNKKLYVSLVKLLVNDFDNGDEAFQFAKTATRISSSIETEVVVFALEYAIEQEKFDILKDLYGPRINSAYTNDRFLYALYLLLLLNSTSVDAQRLVHELTGAEEEFVEGKVSVEKYVDEQSMSGLNKTTSLKFLLQATSCLIAMNSQVATEAFNDFVKSEDKTFEAEDEAESSLKSTSELFLALLKSERFNKLVSDNKIDAALVKSATQKLLEELEKAN